MAAEKLKKAMNGDWEKVVEIYKTDRIAQRASINKTWYTALHIAVADGKEEMLAKLVKLIVDKDKKKG